jgi:hypothetical protein
MSGISLSSDPTAPGSVAARLHPVRFRKVKREFADRSEFELTASEPDFPAPALAGPSAGAPQATRRGVRSGEYRAASESVRDDAEGSRPTIDQIYQASTNKVAA